MNDVVAFADYSWRYREQESASLHSINLTVRRGEKIALVGQSGSGKSTIIQALNGFIPHRVQGEASGSVLVFGAPPAARALPELSDEIGTVLQDTDAQFVGLTVAEDLAFALENSAVAQADMRARVHEAARLIHVEELLEHAPRDLSGGQRQRVSMGGVIIAGAELILVDEPLASLDPASGRRSVELIDELSAAGHTVVIVEHRLEEVLHRELDRIVLMDHGRIVADAAPAELIVNGDLTRHGIREPLSVTALRYAGVTVHEGMRPERPDHLELSESELLALTNWLEQDDVAQSAAAQLEELEPLLELREVTFSHGANRVLHGINLSIRPGELIALCGPNGTGKSTLANLMCGFLRPDSGSIRLRGVDVTRGTIAERAREIGYVLQNPNDMISQHLIRDELRLGTAELDLTDVELEARIDEALTRCGLWPYRSWPISALSYGQRKRVTIAAVLVRRPALLILDEPTAGQDWAHANEFMELIRSLNDAGTAVVLITHDVQLALDASDRMILLEGGTVLVDDTTPRVFAEGELLARASLHETSLGALARALDEHAGRPASRETSWRLHERFISADRAARRAAPPVLAENQGSETGGEAHG